MGDGACQIQPPISSLRTLGLGLRFLLCNLPSRRAPQRSRFSEFNLEVWPGLTHFLLNCKLSVRVRNMEIHHASQPPRSGGQEEVWRGYFRDKERASHSLPAQHTPESYAGMFVLFASGFDSWTNTNSPEKVHFLNYHQPFYTPPWIVLHDPFGRKPLKKQTPKSRKRWSPRRRGRNWSYFLVWCRTGFALCASWSFVLFFFHIKKWDQQFIDFPKTS